ncbi:MAG TPA: polysaccharide ABC transporter ATP-binding protein [Caulobacteraceae bacterium]|nr:polysaccharide ABC transporter ATP-binding protein [Caulobacteraceae bacterium]
MSRPIIEARGLSKRYRLGRLGATSLRQEAERLFGGRAPDEPAPEDFWALKDVSFDVAAGEVLGVIGRNGAGKSTLLKLLSRVTAPTAGEIRLRGRVASLLEVGTGFHPELTGRENVFLNGAILGMTRAEIRRKFDAIAQFAEVDRFLDTPVKRYSSGMYVRLAFAVAAHLEPEILIVDEVLAVGDAEFQQKCLGKMRSVAAGEGRTVIFVSHNMTAIGSLCERALLLEGGEVAAEGPARDVVARYLSRENRAAASLRHRLWEPTDAPGDARARIRRLAVAAPDGRPFGPQEPIPIEVEFWNLADGGQPQVNLMLYGSAGGEVLEDWAASEPGWTGGPMPAGLYRTVCTVPGGLLNEGEYRVRIVLFDNATVRPICDLDEALRFEVRDLRPRAVNWTGRFIGDVHPTLGWRTTRLEGPARPGKIRAAE